MSVWRVVRAVYKMLLAAYGAHRLASSLHGQAKSQPWPDWNIYEAFTKYVAVPWESALAPALGPCLAGCLDEDDIHEVMYDHESD